MIPAERALLALLAGLLGCASHSSWNATPTPAPGTPDVFVIDSSKGAMLAVSPTCAVHLVDPASGTTLTLVRSDMPRGLGPFGDYSLTPTASYGLRPDQLLRVDCATEKPLGAVSR
jgi:hypothetical protein